MIIPCLNEAATVGVCVQKASRALERAGLSYEVVVGDNGSTDGSQEIARASGARVCNVASRGYGHALKVAIAAARGRYLVMGDADDTYDFEGIAAFVAQLQQGHDLVMGSRFKGEIRPGAMPALHRYIGNPVLTAILNLFFGANVSDAHCGLRAFTQEAYARMAPKSGGMEFASELVIRAAQERLRIAEVPTTLDPDRRNRPPHLRSFRDGWRHLRFMLMFSPAWLFLVPGALFLGPGIFLLCALALVDITIADYTLGLHFSVLGSMLTLLGTSILQLGAYAKVVFVGQRIGSDPLGNWLLRSFRLEFFLIMGFLLGLSGLLGDGLVLYDWVQQGSVELPPPVTMRVLLFSTAIIVGVQSLFSSFFLSILRGAFTSVWVD